MTTPTSSNFPFDNVSNEHDEPYKKQQGWGLSIEIPEFSCRMCGAPVEGIEDFCSLCNSKQERVVLQATYDRCHCVYSRAKADLQAAKEALRKNTAAQQAHRM